MRGFVASGGGSKGQWHVGVLKYLLGEKETVYDAYAGVSVGALVTSFIAQYPTGQERQAAQDLAELFTPIRDSDIYKRWCPFGMLHALWEPSLFDSSPLEKLVQKKLDEAAVAASGKKLRVGAYNLESGRYELFDETTSPLWKAVVASASYPVAFKPVRINKQLYTDGGVQRVTPIKALIDLGCNEIDVSICHPLEPSRGFDKDPETVDVALRAIEAMGDEILMKDIKMAQMYNTLCTVGCAPGKRKIQLRIIHPQTTLVDSSLHFDPREAVELQLLGYATAQRS